MTKPRLSLYSTERELLDSALSSGGIAVSFPTHGQAVYFRQRCYQFRKIFAGTSPDSPYDKLTLPKLSPDSLEVLITLREPKHTGVRLLGEPILVADDDDLDEIELEIKDDL